MSQEIEIVQVDSIPGVEGQYRVGFGGVTRIEACTKSGMYADIPYVRVWGSVPGGIIGEEALIAEFCQHNIVGVYFKQEKARG